MSRSLRVGRRLPKSFYERDALEVARDLLGRVLRRDELVLRITEVEAYRWPNDSASHARSGRTERNAAMWGPPGRVYVYRCYGIHHLLNVVTGPEHGAAAVLIRACEPISGLATLHQRRAGASGPALLAGPGRVGASLGLDLSWCHHPLYRARGLELCAGERAEHIVAGPRIGIAYARPEDVDAPWRLAVAGSRWVSHPKALGPVDPPQLLASARLASEP